MGILEIANSLLIFFIATNPLFDGNIVSNDVTLDTTEVVEEEVNQEFGIMKYEPELIENGEESEFENSQATQESGKVEAYNMSSSRVIGSVSGKATENSKALVSCNNLPEKCYPIPVTEEKSVEVQISPAPAPIVTLSPTPSPIPGPVFEPKPILVPSMYPIKSWCPGPVSQVNKDEINCPDL